MLYPWPLQSNDIQPEFILISFNFIFFRLRVKQWSTGKKRKRAKTNDGQKTISDSHSIKRLKVRNELDHAFLLNALYFELAEKGIVIKIEESLQNKISISLKIQLVVWTNNLRSHSQ